MVVVPYALGYDFWFGWLIWFGLVFFLGLGHPVDGRYAHAAGRQ